jgi:hypothetical protein
MKSILVALCLFCIAGAAFGQAAVTASGLSNEPVVYEFQSHAVHAAPQTMGQEQTLLIGSGNVQARGVRPLWEVVTPAYVTPLGDSARLLRKEHASAKKAEIVWNN